MVLGGLGSGLHSTMHFEVWAHIDCLGTRAQCDRVTRKGPFAPALCTLTVWQGFCIFDASEGLFSVRKNELFVF